MRAELQKNWKRSKEAVYTSTDWVHLSRELQPLCWVLICGKLIWQCKDASDHCRPNPEVLRLHNISLPTL